jgi:hypothetical protein
MATKKVAFKVEVDTGKAEKSTEALTDDFKDLNKEVDKVGKTTKKTTKDIDKGFKGASDSGKELASSMGGATGAAANLASGIKGMTKAAIAFIMTPLGLLLAGIAVTIAAVKAAFTDSEEGQNKYARIMAQIGVVVGNLRDLLADYGEKVIAAFENPQESLKAFGELIKENVVNRFNGLIELVPQLAKAVQALFKGDFGEAGQIATDALVKVSLGIEDATAKTKELVDATKDFIDVTIEEAKEGAKVADMRAEADLLERSLLVERSKLEGRIAELRLKARQEDQFGAQERKDAINEAIELQDGLLSAETKVLQLRADAQTLENTFSRSNKENLDLEAKAIAAVNRQTATRLNTQRQFQRELNTINAQIAAAESASSKAKEDEMKKQADEELRLRKELADANIQLIEDEEEQEVAKANERFARKLEKITGESQIEHDLRKALLQVNGAEVQAIHDKHNAERLAKEKESHDASIQAEVDLANARINAASSIGNALGQIGNLISQQSEDNVAAAKAFAVAQIAIDTAVAIAGAIKTATSGSATPWDMIAGIAAGIAAVLGAIGQASAILNSVQVPGPSSTIPTVNVPSLPSSTAPTGEEVTTDGTDIGNAAQAQLAPIQAFVVETDITGNQSNINQIESQITFG